MSGSRLEKIGTIYSRASGLIKSGALQWNDRPLWYDIYEAFPPKEEPKYDRPIPNMPLKKVFYEEDVIRALFHKNNKQIGAVNMSNNSHKYKTLTQRFINCYQKLDLQYEGKTSRDQLYQEAVELLKRERDSKKEATEVEVDDFGSLSEAFNEAQENEPQNKLNKKEEANITIKVTDIFKE